MTFSPAQLIAWFRDMRWRIPRAFQMLKFYWGTEDCDWAVAAGLLRWQIKRIRQHVQRDHFIVDADRISRQMLIAETLLERMTQEPYYDIAEKRYPDKNKHWAEMVTALANQDDALLAKELRRHFRSWWD